MAASGGGSQDIFGDRRLLRHGFRIRPLDSALFRTGSTPLLDRVKLRNHILQRVVTLMSLSRPAKGRYNRRGRISYAQLGINQLGAVYEALLPYRGFFAEEDLYEVKKAKDKPDVLKGAWFVNAAELENYTEDERVYETDEDGSKRLRMHPKGCFVYRLRGRDRQKSASYYTPESLTRCVVKHSLNELIHDCMSADEILDLTVCEPAMGSAAFLNEAVNQLAKSYLARKQREHGQRIPHEEYADELQRAKHFIADRNVYGVDLNPMAVELGEVSLWAEQHAPRRARALVRIPAGLREFAGWGSSAGVSDQAIGEAEDGWPLVQRGAGTRGAEAVRQFRGAQASGHRLSLSAP